MDNTTSVQDAVIVLQANLNNFFLIIMGCLIFFMQTGFAFLEAGSVRSKNTTNILIKNLLDVFLGAIAYWLFGYAFAFGSESNGFIGYKYFALSDLPLSLYSHWFFHFVFAATAATIVSGAMAERTEFKAYLVYSVFLTDNVTQLFSRRQVQIRRLNTVTIVGYSRQIFRSEYLF